MKIFIDNREADIDDASTISVSLSLTSAVSPEINRTGYTKTVYLPMSIRNMEIMGDSGQVNSPAVFNKGEHTARIEEDGFTIFEGTPVLTACHSENNGAGYYSINIIGPGKQWATLAANTPLRQIGIDFSETVDGGFIYDSWSGEKPVRFLPVERDRFYPQNANSYLFPPTRIITFEDYHPFLHVKSMLEEIFRQAGYSIMSEFIDSGYFDSLYMSGNYPVKNTDIIRERMDFKAGRFANVKAVADAYGRVFADPYRGTNSISNIVVTADPAETENGSTVEGVFNTNNCFRKMDRRVAFVPVAEVVAGFEYFISYTTDYYIKNRDELTGFDTIDLEEGFERRYPLANNNADHRDEFKANFTYTLVVFNHKVGNKYAFYYDEIKNPTTGTVNRITLKNFITRSTSITAITSSLVANPQLYIQNDSGVYVKYDGDWALYNGYVTETGEMQVEITVRSIPERILPSEPKYFDLIYLGGAQAGMSFTLEKETTVKPYFAEYPSEGSVMDFATVAAHDMSALDLIKGLKHMFNLCFYTDEMTKSVIIEPRERFYLTDAVTDWSDKLDLGKPIVVSELGVDLGKQITYRYQSTDGAATQWGYQNGEIFGAWTTEIENAFAGSGESMSKNPVFAPSLNLAGNFPDARSALFLQAGERGLSAAEKEEGLNFPAKIVRYLGLAPLPSGQHWGWPGNQARYPFLAFHHAGTGVVSAAELFIDDSGEALEKGFTLCFEDRDGKAGLHRLYDQTVSVWNDGRYVEAYVNLGPEDIEPLVNPNSLKQDFRALYSLTIDGESTLLRLEQVCDYIPGSGKPTKCVFVKEI